MSIKRSLVMAGKSEVISSSILEIKQELLLSDRTELVMKALSRCEEIWEANNKLLRCLGYHAEEDTNE